jgi:hypothetical protein
MSKHLHPDILAKIEASKKQGGIELDKLAIGTKIEAQTRNTFYKIEKLPNGRFRVEGGTYFSQPKETYIGGSTWGGSMMKINWMAVGMHISFSQCDTTAVQKLKVIAPDGSWEYDFTASLV